MRRLVKFLHTVGTAGFTGGVAALALIIVLTPPSITLGGYAPITATMAKLGAWVIGPSMILTVVTGLLAMLVTPGYRDAGWVWAKLATGILVFQGGVHVLGPVGEEAKLAENALARGADPFSAVSLLQAEANMLWVLFAVAVANIALGVWRPRFPKYPV